MEIPLIGSLDFLSVQSLISSFFPDWMAYLIAGVLLSFMVINAMVISTALYTWFERRVIGRFHSRLGPNRWGPFGLFQPLADVVKLMTKEDTVPESADRMVFNVAPVILLTSTLLVVSVIPFGDNTFLGRLNVGAIFIIGITSVNTIAILAAGWASRN